MGAAVRLAVATAALLALGLSLSAAVDRSAGQVTTALHDAVLASASR